MYTQKYSESASLCSTLAGARHDIVSLCVAVALVAHGSGRAGRLCSLPTAPSVTLRTFRVRGVTRTGLPERKKVSTLTSDDAVTCQNIPGSLRISDVGSKVITKIVRAEEGEPGDEATNCAIHMIIHYNCTIGSFLLHFFLLIYHPYPPSFHVYITTLACQISGTH